MQGALPLSLPQQIRERDRLVPHAVQEASIRLNKEGSREEIELDGVPVQEQEPGLPNDT